MRGLHTRMPQRVQGHGSHWLCVLFLVGVALLPLPTRAQYFPLGQPVITATPAPPWAPGQCVTFSTTISGFEVNPTYFLPGPPPTTTTISQFFHGIGILPTPCWTNLTYGTPPPAVHDLTGTWVVDLAQIIPGFYFETGNGCFPCNPATTADNWGDGQTTIPFPPGSGPWTFTWSACVPATISGTCVLGMGMQVFGDGESGSYTEIPPLLEPVIEFPNPQVLTDFTLPSAVCLDSLLVIAAPGAQPGVSYTYNFDGAIIVSGTGAGPYEIRWNNLGTKVVVRTSTDLNTGLVSNDTARVRVVPQGNPSFTLIPPAVCNLRDTALVTFTGTAPVGTSFFWNFDGATVISGSGQGPFRVVWPTPGFRVLSLQLENGACRSRTQTLNVTVGDIANEGIIAPPKVCVDSVALINSVFCIPPANANFSFTFDGGLVLSGNGPGPYQVRWATPGPKRIIRTRTLLANNDIRRDTITIDVLPPPSTVFTLSNSGACVAEPVTVTYGGTLSPGDTLIWDFDGGNVIGGAAPAGPFLVTYGTTGLKNIRLRSRRAIGCESPLNTVTLQVTSRPNTSFTLTGTQCIGDIHTLTYTGNDTNAIITWSLDGGQILGGGPAEGPGPFQVFWPSSGIKTIQVRVKYPACELVSTNRFTIRQSPQVSASNAVFYCQNGQPTTITATVTGAQPGCTFRWEPQQGLSNPFALTTLAAPFNTTQYRLIVTCGACPPDTDFTTVRVVVRPTATRLTNPILQVCEGAGGVQLNAQGAGGTGNLTYRWDPINGLSNPNIPNPVANPSVTTTYWLKVRDDNACQSDSVSITVRVNPVPRVDAGPDQTICDPANPAQLLATPLVGGNFLYQWSPSLGLNNPNIQNPVALPPTTTIYTVTLTDLTNGCPSPPPDTLSTVVVRRSNRPIANAGVPRHEICEGDSVMIGGLAYGSGPDYSYTWTPSTAVGNPNSPFTRVAPSITTTYFQRVLSNGCFGDLASTVVVVRQRENFAVTNRNVFACPGTPVQLGVTTSGSPNLRIRWTPETGLDNPTLANPTVLNPQASTKYYVVVGTDVCPGNFRDSVEVTVPDPPRVRADTTNSPSGLIFCSDLPGIQIPADVQASGSVLISWSPATGLSATNVLRPFANPRQATFYVLSVFNNGCTYRDTVLVTPLLGLQARIVQNDTIICRGTSIPLRVNEGLGSATVRWTPAAGLNNPNVANPIASPIQRTKYFVRIQEAGCVSDDSIVIDVADQPIARFGVSPDIIGCNSYTLTFLDSSIHAAQLIWDFGDGSPLVPNSLAPRHTYQNPGVYRARLLVDGPQGYCKDTAERIIRVVAGPQLAASASVIAGESIYLPNASVQFEDNTPGAVSWLWFFGDGSNSTQQRPEHLYTEVNDTGYRPLLIVQDINGCIDSLELGPIRVLPPFLAETPNVFTPNGDNINDRFAIPYEGSDRYTLQIFDRYGQRVFETINPQMSWNGKLNNVDQEVADGVYFWVLKVGVRRFQGNVTLLR